MNRRERRKLGIPFVKKEEENLPDPKLKGKYLGNCNRTACQKPGAVFYNHSTREHYCPKCARLINDVNPEAMELMTMGVKPEPRSIIRTLKAWTNSTVPLIVMPAAKVKTTGAEFS